MKNTALHCQRKAFLQTLSPVHLNNYFFSSPLCKLLCIHLGLEQRGANSQPPRRGFHTVFAIQPSSVKRCGCWQQEAQRCQFYSKPFISNADFSLFGMRRVSHHVKSPEVALSKEGGGQGVAAARCLACHAGACGLALAVCACRGGS